MRKLLIVLAFCAIGTLFIVPSCSESIRGGRSYPADLGAGHDLIDVSHDLAVTVPCGDVDRPATCDTDMSVQPDLAVALDFTAPPDMSVTQSDGGCNGPHLFGACVPFGVPGPHCCLPFVCYVKACASVPDGGIECEQWCVKAPGEPCAANLECVSEMCKAGVCW